MRRANDRITLDKLDAVFDKALVLLSILAVAELAYITALPSSTGSLLSELKLSVLIETTLSFLVLIPIFIVKELFVKTNQGRAVFFSYFAGIYGVLLFMFSFLF